MALSVVASAAHQHQPSFFDLQSLFDPYSLQQHQQDIKFVNQQQQHNHQQHHQLQQQHTKSAKFCSPDSMEFNSNNNNTNTSSDNNHNHNLLQVIKLLRIKYIIIVSKKII